MKCTTLLFKLYCPEFARIVAPKYWIVNWSNNIKNIESLVSLRIEKWKNILKIGNHKSDKNHWILLLTFKTILETQKENYL